MSTNGDTELLEARGALLDAIEALREQRHAIVVIGAQAVYLHTGGAPVALAEATKDSDLALDSRVLHDEPTIEHAMRAAGFPLDRDAQPGAWVSGAGVPVDLMVPEALAGPRGRRSRSARIPPHARKTTRRATGLEGTVVDCAPMEIGALETHDKRRYVVRVAGPAGLIVAKLHKLHERRMTPTRLNDKDAHDVYRLLVSVPTAVTAAGFDRLLADHLSRPVTEAGLAQLRTLFAEGPTALGARMAGQAEERLGDPEVVAASASVLADDLLRVLPERPSAVSR
jgi:hypothetical protein